MYQTQSTINIFFYISAFSFCSASFLPVSFYCKHAKKFSLKIPVDLLRQSLVAKDLISFKKLIYDLHVRVA